MKKLVRASLIIFFIIILETSSFAAQGTKVIVNGKTLVLEEKLIHKEGTSYIAIQDIAPALNFEINWSTDRNTINLKNENMIIGIQANNQWYSKKTKDGKVGTFNFNAATIPTVINGNHYVPISNFAIVAGSSIEWDANRNIYNIIQGWDLKYASNSKVSVYAGTGKKGWKDGALSQSQFKYAHSIYTTKDKTTYVADSGILRKITNNTVESLKIEPNDIKVATLKGIDDEVYALSTKYTNAKKEEQYGIFKLDGNTLKEIHLQNAKEAKIIDFDIASTRTMCILKEEIATGKRFIEMINLKGAATTAKVEVDKVFACLTLAGDKVYLGNDNGSIYCYDIKTKALELVAGTDNVHRFKDGDEPLFCLPKKIKYYKGNLYVLDYNILRKGTISTSGKVISWQTVAGKATGEINGKMSSGTAEKLLLSTVNPIDFTISDEGILITDATQFKIMRIK